mgnify:CR=1 FL=1
MVSFVGCKFFSDEFLMFFFQFFMNKSGPQRREQVNHIIYRSEPHYYFYCFAKKNCAFMFGTSEQHHSKKWTTSENQTHCTCWCSRLILRHTKQIAFHTKGYELLNKWSELLFSIIPQTKQIALEKEVNLPWGFFSHFLQGEPLRGCTFFYKGNRYLFLQVNNKEFHSALHGVWINTKKWTPAIKK